MRSLEESAMLLQKNRLDPNCRRYYLQALSDLAAVCIELDDANTVTDLDHAMAATDDRTGHGALQRCFPRSQASNPLTESQPLR